MKTKINLLLFLTFSIFTFAQGFGSSKTTQSLNFPTSDNVAEGKARIYIMRTTGTLEPEKALKLIPEFEKSKVNFIE